MGKSKKKPRKKMNPKQFEACSREKIKKDDDWTFDDIVRSKSRRR